MPTRQVKFTREEFREMFDAASRYCVDVAISRGWLPEVPRDLAFHCGVFDCRFHLSEDHRDRHVPAATMMPPDELLMHLQRDTDGHHRSWINLAPLALHDSRTVVDVSFNPDDWVDFVFTDDLAVGDHEPFQIRGPALPPDWSEGDPIPCVQLPTLHLVADWCFPVPKFEF